MCYESFLEYINTLSDEELRDLEKTTSELRKLIEEAIPLKCKKIILKLEKYIGGNSKDRCGKSFEEFIDCILWKYYKTALTNRLIPEKPPDLNFARKFLNSPLGAKVSLDFVEAFKV